MAREIESKTCDAWVIMGTAQSGAILPCERWGEGKCLKDLRIEAGLPNVSVVSGTCKADSDQGLTSEEDPSKLINEIRDKGGLGIDVVLDNILGKKPEKPS